MSEHYFPQYDADDLRDGTIAALRADRDRERELREKAEQMLGMIVEAGGLSVTIADAKSLRARVDAAEAEVEERKRQLDALIEDLAKSIKHERARADALAVEVEELKRGDEQRVRDLTRHIERADAAEATLDRVKCSDSLLETCKELIKAEAESARLKEALRGAIESIEEWGGYASEYFQEKWDLKGQIEKARAALASTAEGKEQKK